MMILNEMSAGAPGSHVDSATRDRIHIEAVTRSGRAVAVEVRLRRDLVEVWLGQHCCGIFDRDTLRT